MHTALTLQQALDCYRKTDAVFIVCQNNAAKTLEVVALNDEARQISDYSDEMIIGKSLFTLLPERIIHIIEDHLTYETENDDINQILSKIRDFALQKRDGTETAFKLRIIAGEIWEGNPLFHLVMVDEQKTRDNDAFRRIIKENFKGHEVLDPATGLPDRVSIAKDVELVVYYVRDKNITASFAIIDINNYLQIKQEYGEQFCKQVIQHINVLFRSKLRPEDTIGILSEQTLGVILVGSSQEEARMVLNRLRWAISTTPIALPKKEFTATVTISFAQIDGKLDHWSVIEKCEAFTKEQRSHQHNAIALVVTHERRAGDSKTDRRQSNVAVAVDKRRGERRK